MILLFSYRGKNVISYKSDFSSIIKLYMDFNNLPISIANTVGEYLRELYGAIGFNKYNMTLTLTR